MKNIHPDYQETTITCACGNVIHTRSTKKDIRVEICSKCHPFFTGKQKLVDTSGRVDMFNKRYGIVQGGALSGIAHFFSKGKSRSFQNRGER